MADDGGSSGRLRSELGIQPPGDIRNCLVAMADSEAVMQQLMDYRFSSDGQLNGHSFGNMLIAALAGIGGDFYRAVEIAGELLAIRGRVIPSTTTDVTLIARTEAGETLTGETSVASAPARIQSLTLSPLNPQAHPEAVSALEEADLIIIGPGSLYTSIVPNLLIPGIAEAVGNSRALKIYICNVAEEPRQTEGYSVQEHLDVVRRYVGDNSVHAVIANGRIPAGPTPAGLDFIRPRRPWDDNALLVEADVIDESATAGMTRPSWPKRWPPPTAPTGASGGGCPNRSPLPLLAVARGNSSRRLFAVIRRPFPAPVQRAQTTRKAEQMREFSLIRDCRAGRRRVAPL